MREMWTRVIKEFLGILVVKDLALFTIMAQVTAEAQF